MDIRTLRIGTPESSASWLVIPNLPGDLLHRHGFSNRCVLQRIDSIWEVLHPNEQRRVLELLVEKIAVSKENVEVRFRANGIEQVVEELPFEELRSLRTLDSFGRGRRLARAHGASRVEAIGAGRND